MQNIRFVLLLFLVTAVTFAVSPDEKYTGYRYVFSEFDIDQSYIYNKDFVHFCSQHEKNLERFYHRSLKRGTWLVHMIRGELLESGLSDLFLYLAIVESGLSPTAVSSKHAVGLWQFMPSTAKAYHLRVCSDVDERCNAFSATGAAIEHLKRLHDKFGKWYLAVMAYNCGEGRMQKALRQAGTEEIDILTDRHAGYLPKETIEYLQKILLVAMTAESKNIYEESTVGTTHTFALSSPAIPSKHTFAYYTSHTVKLGESLESIAKAYRSTVSSIKYANGLDEDILEQGSFLLIPVSQDYFDTVSKK